MNEKLLKRLEDEKQWAELTLFERHAVGERPELLKAMLARAVKKHEEAGALRLLELLKLAIEDVHAETLHKEDPEPAKKAERGRFHEEACKTDQAKAAFALWQASPSHRDGRWHDRETYESGKTQDPTLLKYKQALLEGVVKRWRETDDADEAEALFIGLVDACVRRDPGGHDLLVNACRASEDHHAHRERTMAHLLRYVTMTPSSGLAGGMKDIAPTLWIGMMRKLDRREIAALGAILRHLPLSQLGPSWTRGFDADPMVQALARDAEAYRRTHEAFGRLRTSLKLKKGEIRTFDPVYDRPDRVTLKVAIEYAWADRKDQENVFHDLFAELREQVRAWHKAEPVVRFLKLEAYWPVPHGKPRLVRYDELA